MIDSGQAVRCVVDGLTRVLYCSIVHAYAFLCRVLCSLRLNSAIYILLTYQSKVICKDGVEV